MKYKPGDKVRVRRDLEERYDCSPVVREQMAEMKGKTLTIRASAGPYGYKVHENTWSWSGDMLEPAEETEDFPILSPNMVDDFIENVIKANKTPSHYDIPGIEQPLMDIIFAVCENNTESKKEYCFLYNALKYMFRYGNKNGQEDLEKAKDYITRIEEIRYTNERR